MEGGLPPPSDKSPYSRSKSIGRFDLPKPDLQVFAHSLALLQALMHQRQRLTPDFSGLGSSCFKEEGPPRGAAASQMDGRALNV